MPKESHPAPPDQFGILNDFQRAQFTALKQDTTYFVPCPGPRTWFDDSTILRFLRAKNWHGERALKQLQATNDWRKALDVDTLYETFDVEEFERTKKLCPRWTGRRDRLGRPVVVYQMGEMATPDYLRQLSIIPLDRQYAQLVALSEVGCRFLFGLCSALNDRTPYDPARVGQPITCYTSIVDMEGLSFVGFWKLRSYLERSTRFTSSHHPETSYIIAIVNAPVFFSAIWNWIKGWMDEGTRNKILILSKQTMKEELESIIDPKDLPLAYGGSLEWSCQDEPILDEQLSGLLGGVTHPPRGPWSWEDGKKKLLGTVDGEPREDRDLSE